MPFNYASNQALQALVTKVESLLAGKVNTEAGKGLSTNDLTNELKTQYDAAYAHSQAAHAPTDAEKNVIIAVTFNGTAATIDPVTRTAAITATIPTKVSELTNDSGFQTASDVSGAISTALGNYYNKTETDGKIAAAVAAANHLKYQIVESLPDSNQDANTIYLLAKDDGAGQDVYTEYMWLNDKWEILGDTSVDLTNYYTKAQTDEAITTALANYVKTTDMVEITAAEVQGMFS